LHRFFISFVGTSADGAMLRTGYGNTLNSLVSPDAESYDFYSHIWDPGHLVELGHEDTVRNKKATTYHWVEKRLDIISRRHKEVGYGKSLEEIKLDAIREAEENGIGTGSTRSPAIFSKP